MIRPHWLLSLTTGIALVSAASNAAAQASVLPESIPVGQWTFRPTVEVRVRGEYRRHPFDAGGDVYDPTAVLAESPTSVLPPITISMPAMPPNS